jgi:hypothetical protein
MTGVALPVAPQFSSHIFGFLNQIGPFGIEAHQPVLQVSHARRPDPIDDLVPSLVALSPRTQFSHSVPILV